MQQLLQRYTCHTVAKRDPSCTIHSLMTGAPSLTLRPPTEWSPCGAIMAGPPARLRQTAQTFAMAQTCKLQAGLRAQHHPSSLDTWLACHSLLHGNAASEVKHAATRPTDVIITAFKAAAAAAVARLEPGAVPVAPVACGAAQDQPCRPLAGQCRAAVRRCAAEEACQM